MDQPPQIIEAQPSEPATTSMSLPARLLNIIAAPGDSFDYIRNKPVSTANWLVPALVLILASWIGAWVIFSQDSINQQLVEISTKAIDKQVEKGKLTKEQAEPARQAAEKYGAIGAKVLGVVAPVLAAFVVPFWGGLIIWLVGAKAMKGGFSYMKAVEIAGLANVVGVLEVVVRSLLIVVKGNLYASPSLALLAKDVDPQAPLFGVLSALNFMTFWLLAVRSIGVARFSSVSFAKAALWIYGIWAFLTTIMVAFGFAMRALSGG